VRLTGARRDRPIGGGAATVAGPGPLEDAPDSSGVEGAMERSLDNQVSASILCKCRVEGLALGPRSRGQAGAEARLVRGCGALLSRGDRW
jgi:hypothetical protein